MTVPGVNLIVAATFLGAIGDIRRFRGARQLTAYLGLDPRVRQSGTGPTRHGKISKQGSAPVRKALVEAAWSAVRNPGPMRAFYQRVRARRGHQIAIVASARKLAGLFWCLLTREQDYAYGRPSLTAVKLRRLEITAGAPRWQKRTGAWAANHALADAERRLAEQAEAAYKQLVKDRQAAGPHDRSHSQQAALDFHPSRSNFLAEGLKRRRSVLSGTGRHQPLRRFRLSDQGWARGAGAAAVDLSAVGRC